MAASGKVLGTVTSVVGEAKATAADGTVRILQVGDVVHSDETITTSAAGAVNIALENGKMLDCGANSDLSLHESILGVATAASNVPGAPGAAAPGSVEALQQAIASGQDPSQIAPATAAGGAPAAGGAGGDGGGGTPVIVEQANSAGPITAGFGTAGAGIAFPTPEFQLIPPTQNEEQPTVSVSVQVQVEVGVTPGETSGQVTVPTHPVVSTDATGIVEGTGGEAPRLVNFVIKLSQSFDTDVQVTYQIVSGPANPAVQADAAQAQSDYTGVLTATITIPAGTTEFVVPVMIVQDHFVENNENFSIVLTNAENATIDPSHNSAVVTIQDDDTAPVAHADTNWTQEDTHVVATGNVIAGQVHVGAPLGSFADLQDVDADGDVPHVLSPGTFVGTYGTLTLNTDGSYTYVLNNTSAAVQALAQGQQVTEVPFPYSATDGFNTPSASTLTITIFGTNDVPEIHVNEGADRGATQEDVTLSALGQLTSSDVDTGATASWSVNGTSSSTFGSFAVDQSGKWTYTLNNGTNGVDGPVQDLAVGQTITEQYTVRVTDDKGATDDQVVTITIMGTNDQPTVTGGSGVVQEDGVQIASGNITFGDIDTLDVNALTVKSADGNNTAQSIGEGTTATVSVAGTYGSLTLDQAGHWVYTLNNSAPNVQALAQGQQVTETFPVSNADTHGGVANNAIVITITGTNDVPEIHVNEGADRGATQEDVTLSALGQLTSSDVDTGATASWSVNGTSSSTFGSFAVDQSGKWTYTLNNGTNGVDGPVQDLAVGQTITEQYTVRVTDDKGATDDQVVTITIMGTNDQPTVTGGSGVVQEDGVQIASGNITFGDIDTLDVNALTVKSADGNNTAQSIGEGTTATVSVAGTYGSLTLDQAGHWVYTLNNSAPNVQALAQGQQVTETFPVSNADTHGGVANNAIVITITGTNDVPVISSVPPATVSEEGLQGGNPDSVGTPSDVTDSVTATGTVLASDVDTGTSLTMTLSAPAGDFTSAGTPIEWALSNGGHTLIGSAGEGPVVTITIANTGAYTVTLSGQIDHPTADVEDVLTLNVGVKVFDGIETATGTLAVSIEDDSPVIDASNIAIPNLQATYEGMYEFSVGGDFAPFSANFPDSALEWTNAPDGFTFNLVSSNSSQLVYEAKATSSEAEDPAFFRITVHDGGTYDFELVTAKPIVEHTVDVLGSITNAPSGPVDSYTFDKSLFGGFFDLTVSGYDTKAGADTVTISSTDLGVNGNSIQPDETAVFQVVPHDGFENINLSSLKITVDHAGVKEGDNVDLTVFYTSGSVPIHGQIETEGSDLVAVFQIDQTKTVDHLELHPLEGNLKVVGIDLNYVETQFPGDYDLQFKLTGADADSDHAAANFAVAVNTADPEGHYNISGTSGSDAVYGTSGSDTFVWASADAGTVGSPAADMVQNFGSGDVLNLQDLLPDASTGAYLYVTQDQGGTTIHVTDGTLVNSQADTSGAHDIQTIALAGYTSANDSIQNILNALTTNQTYTHT